MHQKSLKFKIIQGLSFHELSEWEYIGKGWDVDGMSNWGSPPNFGLSGPEAILDGWQDGQELGWVGGFAKTILYKSK